MKPLSNISPLFFFFFIAVSLVIIGAGVFFFTYPKAISFRVAKQQSNQNILHGKRQDQQHFSPSDTTGSSPPSNSQLYELMHGHYKCNKYGKGQGSISLVPNSYAYLYVPPDSYMASCRIENLCLASNGDFVLFHSKDRLIDAERMGAMLNRVPWVYTQGTIATSRGNFYVRLVDADLVVKYKSSVGAGGGKGSKNSGGGKRKYNGGVASSRSDGGPESSSSPSDYDSNSDLLSSSTINPEQVMPEEEEEEEGIYKPRVERIVARKVKDGFACSVKDTMENNCESVQPNVQINELKLSPNFKFYTNPVFGVKRYAAGNVGHNLSETLSMIISLMMNFMYEEDVLGMNHVLYLDDVFETHGDEWMASHGYDPDLSSRYSIQIANLVSANPVLQVCRRDENHFITNAPCKNTPPPPSLSSSGMEETVEKAPRSPTDNITDLNLNDIVLDSCFTQFYAGYTISNLLLNMYGKESSLVKLREVTYTNLNIKPLPIDEEDNEGFAEEGYPSSKIRNFLEKKSIVVAVNRKSHDGKHGQMIHNVDEILDYLKEYLPEEPFLQEFSHMKKLIIEDVVLNEFPSISDQVRYFSNVDVFIADPGSAAYYSMFMRDDTTMFLPPSCLQEQNCTTSYGFNVLAALPSVQVIDIFEMNEMQNLDCNPRPTPFEPKNCDVILPKELILRGVVGALKRRFRKVMGKNINEENTG